MGFWDWLRGADPGGITDNSNPSSSVGAPDWNPGDPDGVDLTAFDEPVEARALPFVNPSPWSGWPAEWSVPNWDFGSKYNALVDIAWACIDLNARVMASMPIYRTIGSQVASKTSWMENPDPSVYSSFQEFAYQMWWDWWCGEFFVLSMARFSSEYPSTFRVIPPGLVHVEASAAGRRYRIGGPAGDDVTDDILHVPYWSTSTSARGVGPLESAGGRMLIAGVLAKYVKKVVETGGIQLQTLETDQELTTEDAQDLLKEWVNSRVKNLGHPPVLDNSVKLVDHKTVSPKDMAMIEIAQFTEGRIADLLGVPRALVGLPTGDSFTYSNVSSWFDHHDRTTLRPAAARVMPALSGWLLPRGQAVELNRDEYSRPPFNERADAWVKLVEAGIVSVDEVREAERFTGEAPTVALTGGEM